MSCTVTVYTRPVDEECYPAGLANSIHMAYTLDGGEEHPLNRNYGILFVKGEISHENTIIPMGMKNPCIFRMPDGQIGIAGERILENGLPDETTAGKLMLWKTTDLIHFRETGFVEREKVMAWDPAESLSVDPELAGKMIRYWEPIRYTNMVVPTGEGSSSKATPMTAELHYSDGSVRTKRIRERSGNRCISDTEKPAGIGCLTQQTFSFPLARGFGDPVIFPWEGKWYFLATNDNLNDIGIYVREAKDVHGLFADDIPQHLILPFDPERGFEQTFWAPEFHVIGGELYILFAVSGHIWGPQCHMMKKKKGESITLADSWEEPIRVVKRDGSPLAEDAITLDMTYVKADKASYVIWSYRENIGTPLDSGSMLYIATIDDTRPWKLTSDPVLLTRPLYGWENVSGTINNEGPHAFSSNGKIYVTYSGGSANGYTYALGLLTADADADLLRLSSWEKSITPVLTFYSVKGEFGPGHNSFFVNEDGELMIAYHAETALQEHLRCDGIRRVHFRKDGSPYFQMSAQEDVPPIVEL